MKIEDYDKKIALAFGGGQGGVYVRENYDDAVRSNETLAEIVINLVHDIQTEINDCPEDVEEEHIELVSHQPCNSAECLEFINKYMGEKMSHPELCGTVAGILFREDKLQEALDFLEVSDMEEERMWDS
jgi:hypothetical protein